MQVYCFCIEKEKQEKLRKIEFRFHRPISMSFYLLMRRLIEPQRYNVITIMIETATFPYTVRVQNDRKEALSC